MVTSAPANANHIIVALPIRDNPIPRRSTEGANGGNVSLCHTETSLRVYLTFWKSSPRNHSMARQWATSAI